MMKRMLAVLAVATVICLAGAPKADAYVSFSIGIPIPGIYVGPAYGPAYYPTAPVYYGPPGYYGAPAYYGYGPGYGGYGPAYGGAVVVGGPRYYGGRYYGGRYYGGAHWGGGGRHWGGQHWHR